MDEALLKINARLSGELASDGMVLLENRADTLPFEPGCRIAVTLSYFHVSKSRSPTQAFT